MPDQALAGKTAIVTGSSRGIGFAIARRLASAGVNIVIAAKTTQPHPKLPGTIYEAAKEINNDGGHAVAVELDVRDENQIEHAVKTAARHFGGIDILVNNASAIYLATTEHTPVKRFDLMHQINVRGTYLMAQACIPYLKESTHAHILNLCPPLKMEEKWFSQHTAYTLSKYGMSMITFGLSAELQESHISVNALWPKTIIATAAVRNLLGGEDMINRSRHPSIVADAACLILAQDPGTATGQFYIDEEVLIRYGITDMEPYAVNKAYEPAPDLFIDL